LHPQGFGENVAIMPEMTLQQALQVAMRHKSAGEFHQAAGICLQILQQQPVQTEASRLLGQIASDLTNRGTSLMANRRFDEALVDLTKAAELYPNRFEPHNNLGTALAEAGRLEEATAAFSRAIQCSPGNAVVQRNLGTVLAKQSRGVEAIGAFRKAIDLKSDYVEAYSDLGVALVEAGQVDEAIKIFQTAIRLSPAFASARWFYAMALLLKGDFVRGLPEYESRWLARDFTSPKRSFAQAQWDGQKLEGRTILLHCEQGFGDSIQFVRYTRMVAARGGTVLLECPAELTRLFASAPGIARLCLAGQTLPPFDVHCPLMSLPMLLGTTLSSIPTSLPYLRAEDELVEHWRARLGDSGGRLRVGLAWAGRSSFSGDRTRSLNLQSLVLLGRVSNVSFFSLQKGPAAAEANRPSDGMDLTNLDAELHDFADTAAVISLMDLVITTDTSIPHLAGALGKPVWTMLQWVPDWRWLLDRTDSPWYPTMQLFRQYTAGDWADVVQRVATALEQRVNAGV